MSSGRSLQSSSWYTASGASFSSDVVDEEASAGQSLLFHDSRSYPRTSAAARSAALSSDQPLSPAAGSSPPLHQ